MEDWWTKETLGPDADPNSWMITAEGVLHIFRRYFFAISDRRIFVYLLRMIMVGLRNRANVNLFNFAL